MKEMKENIIDQSTGQRITKEFIGGFKKEDKGKKIKTQYEQLTEETDFLSIVGSMSSDVNEDLTEDFENQNIMLMRVYEREQPEVIQALIDKGFAQEKLRGIHDKEGEIEVMIRELSKLPTEEAAQEIAEAENIVKINEEAESRKEAKRRREAKKLSEEPREEKKEKQPRFSLTDFRLMEKSAKYNALFNKNPELKKSWPADADGKPLSIEEIQNLAEEYGEYNIQENAGTKDPNRKIYNEADLKLLKICSAWHFLYRQVDAAQKLPTDANNNPLTQKRIDKFDADYVKFKKENPAEFAELKYMNQEWQKADFKWKVENHNGKPQWVYEKKLSVKYKGDKMPTEIKSIYVVQRIPEGFQPSDFKESFYTIEKVQQVDKTSSRIFVDLKPSLEKQTVKAKA